MKESDCFSAVVLVNLEEVDGGRQKGYIALRGPISAQLHAHSWPFSHFHSCPLSSYAAAAATHGRNNNVRKKK